MISMCIGAGIGGVIGGIAMLFLLSLVAAAGERKKCDLIDSLKKTCKTMVERNNELTAKLNDLQQRHDMLLGAHKEANSDQKD